MPVKEVLNDIMCVSPIFRLKGISGRQIGNFKTSVIAPFDAGSNPKQFRCHEGG